MSNSSQPQSSLDTLTISNDILIDLGATGANMSDITITSAGADYNYVYDSSSVVSVVTSGGGGTYTIGPIGNTDTITFDDFNFNSFTEWQNNFPDWDRVQSMCEKYPGLKIAFENFKVFYEMVKDDYDNPTPKK